MVSSHTARQQADVLGMINAGWGDAGLHPETFWLGYASINAAGWHPGYPGPSETMRSYFRLFYGPGGLKIEKIYHLMSRQAQFWSDSWEMSASSLRKPIFGSSGQIFQPKPAAQDFTLALPSPPGDDLTRTSPWRRENRERLRLAAKFQSEYDELDRLLAANLERVQLNRFNLEVLRSIASLCRLNLQLLSDLATIDQRLEEAASTSRHGEPRLALHALDQALETVRDLRSERNRVYQDVVRVWYQSWYPRVGQANGRRYWHELDDVKDHEPDRTVDMSYLIYRELHLPFTAWFERVQRVRNRYAAIHGLPQHEMPFDWTGLDCTP